MEELQKHEVTVAQVQVEQVEQVHQIQFQVRLLLTLAVEVVLHIQVQVEQVEQEAVEQEGLKLLMVQLEQLIQVAAEVAHLLKHHQHQVEHQVVQV